MLTQLLSTLFPADSTEWAQTPIILSVVHRILRGELANSTGLIPKEVQALASQHLAIKSAVPAFIIHVRLKARDGYVSHRDMKHLFDFFVPWLHPCSGIAFAFVRRNWATVGAFREVLDSISGRHLSPKTLAPLLIWRDLACTEIVDDDTPLAGNFYIELPIASLQHFNMVPAQEGPVEDQPPSFARKVRYRCGGSCAFSMAPSQEAEADIEVAHIIPRTSYHIFPRLISKILPMSLVSSVDEPCNGLALWIAIHSAWDHGRATIASPRNILILSKGQLPLSFCQFTEIRRRALAPERYSTELKTLLQLRFSMTLIDWFATPALINFLNVLGREPGWQQSETVELTDQDGNESQVGNEDEAEGEAESEEPYLHHAGCPCAKEEDGPCVLPLLGAVQLWDGLRGGAITATCGT
ncbi:hypothetical protein DFH06DRAFT_1253325 [Mycena polygramma]|nr:hypothetical protein DFH06DRAFT_1253325 [Mycena polygramma]